MASKRRVQYLQEEEIYKMLFEDLPEDNDTDTEVESDNDPDETVTY